MKTVIAILCVLLIVFVVGTSLFFGATPTGKTIWNEWFYRVQKADDATKYETRKSVEDSCRAMIASYTTDKMTYEQYNGNADAEKQEWSDMARMRANKTAAIYNEYVLKNSFVWDGNIPQDILSTLGYIN